MSRSSVISISEIWDRTNGGEDIFADYLDYISYTKNVPSPFRTDRNPSAKLSRSSNNVVYISDYGGNQFSGNALEMICELEGLKLPQAIDKVINTLGLKKNFDKPVIQKRKYTKKADLLIEFQDIPFTVRHKQYFDTYNLDEEFLRNNNVYAVGKLAFNKKMIPIPDYQFMFAYWAKDINKVKLLTLGEKVEKKWINTAPNDYLWYYNNIDKENCKQIWLVKSVKDALLLKRFWNFDVIALQNESAKIFLNSKNYEKIEAITKDVVLALGTDPQGKAQSIEISQERNYKWFNIDNQLFQNYGLTDVSDFVANFSVKSLENKLRIKGYIK